LPGGLEESLGTEDGPGGGEEVDLPQAQAAFWRQRVKALGTRMLETAEPSFLGKSQAIIQFDGSSILGEHLEEIGVDTLLAKEFKVLLQQATSQSFTTKTGTKAGTGVIRTRSAVA
jgi:hypothetical protein